MGNTRNCLQLKPYIFWTLRAIIKELKYYSEKCINNAQHSDQQNA